jgi:hypothetical protein
MNPTALGYFCHLFVINPIVPSAFQIQMRIQVKMAFKEKTRKKSWMFSLEVFPEARKFVVPV